MNNPPLQTSGKRVSQASEFSRREGLLNNLLDASSQGPAGLGKGPQMCVSASPEVVVDDHSEPLDSGNVQLPNVRSQ